MHDGCTCKKYPLRGYFHASPSKKYPLCGQDELSSSKKYPLCGDIFEQMGQIISIFEDICPKWEIICRYQPMNYHLFLRILWDFRLFLGILCSFLRYFVDLWHIFGDFLDISEIICDFRMFFMMVGRQFFDQLSSILGIFSGCASNSIYF